MTIYTPIKPTYLYIKQHSISGLKYFGKTTKDPYKYKGSGVYWTRHIKNHGKEHIVTLWVSELYYDTSIVEHALQFSKKNNIVKSKEWANLEPENGLNGGTPGKILSNEHRSKIAKTLKGKVYSNETKAKMSASRTGKKLKPHSEETKSKRPCFSISGSALPKNLNVLRLLSRCLGIVFSSLEVTYA